MPAAGGDVRMVDDQAPPSLRLVLGNVKGLTAVLQAVRPSAKQARPRGEGAAGGTRPAPRRTGPKVPGGKPLAAAGTGARPARMQLGARATAPCATPCAARCAVMRRAARPQVCNVSVTADGLSLGWADESKAFQSSIYLRAEVGPASIQIIFGVCLLGFWLWIF